MIIDQVSIWSLEKMNKQLFLTFCLLTVFHCSGTVLAGDVDCSEEGIRSWIGTSIFTLYPLVPQIRAQLYPAWWRRCLSVPRRRSLTALTRWALIGGELEYWALIDGEQQYWALIGGELEYWALIGCSAWWRTMTSWRSACSSVCSTAVAGRGCCRRYAACWADTDSTIPVELLIIVQFTY